MWLARPTKAAAAAAVLYCAVCATLMRPAGGDVNHS